MLLPDEKVIVDGTTVDPSTLEAFRQALLIRRVEQSLLELFAAGKLFGTVHTCVGQELTGVAIAAHLCRTTGCSAVIAVTDILSPRPTWSKDSSPR